MFVTSSISGYFSDGGIKLCYPSCPEVPAMEDAANKGDKAVKLYIDHKKNSI